MGIPLDDEGGPEIDADKRNTRVLISRLKEERIQRVASWKRILCFMRNILSAKTIFFQASPNSHFLRKLANLFPLLLVRSLPIIVIVPPCSNSCPPWNEKRRRRSLTKPSKPCLGGMSSLILFFSPSSSRPFYSSNSDPLESEEMNKRRTEIKSHDFISSKGRNSVVGPTFDAATAVSPRVVAVAGLVCRPFLFPR